MIYTCTPLKVSLYDNRKTRYTAAQVKAKTGADIVFNGSLFDMTTYKPCCDVKINGVILNNDPYTYYGYGWKNGELPHVAHTNEMPQLDNYISCIWCIHNGEKQAVNDNQVGVGGTRGRTAFGFKANGEMVIICTSDTKGAMTLSQTRDKLFNEGCINGIILDGGGSSQIIAPTGTITTTRIVSNFVCVWFKQIQKEDKTMSNLKVGSKGAAVKTLQTNLNNLGYSCGVVDGVFGAQTKAAVMVFQKDHGLTIDGIAGAITQAAITACLAETKTTAINIIQLNYKWAYGATLRKSTNYFVLHHLGSTAPTTPEQIHIYHRDTKGWRGIAYNFYVRKDGTIYAGREENAAGGHTENYNSVSIGICFEGNFEEETMSDVQLEAGRKLLAYLQKKYPTAKTVRHRDLNVTACPGKNFPFDKITAKLG